MKGVSRGTVFCSFLHKQNEIPVEPDFANTVIAYVFPSIMVRTHTNPAAVFLNLAVELDSRGAMRFHFFISMAERLQDKANGPGEVYKLTLSISLSPTFLPSLDRSKFTGWRFVTFVIDRECSVCL